MRGLSQFSMHFILVLWLGNTAFAQESNSSNAQSIAPAVTASASTERVRFTAPSSVVQIRLEVYNWAGRKLFDNEVRGGNVLDWLIQDGQAERLTDDTYLCVVTTKGLSGKLSQRIGSLTVEKSAVRMQAAEVSQMSSQQTEAVGPIEENASLLVLKEEERQTPTVIAHNGEEGQIIRGRGALSFRLGDFFSGKDTEQMRLTPEGNLGIGITHPTVRLEVDGLIRSSQGIVFPDGTVQYSASSKTFGRKSSKSNQMPREEQDVGSQASGTGTQNQIAKWMDGAGTLGDSVIAEFNGNIGIGTSAPAKRLHVANGQLALDNQRFLCSRRTNGNFQEAFGIDSNNDIVFNRNSIVNGQDADAPKAPSALIFGTGAGKFMDIRNSANATLMRVDELTGNVGIGTTSPGARFHVAGGMRWGNGSGRPYVYTDEDGSGLFLEQVGTTAANSRMRLQSSVIGAQSEYSQFFIDPANGFSFVSNGGANGKVGIGTTAPQAKLDVRGDVKLGSSGELFAPGGEEKLRIVRGGILCESTPSIFAGVGFSVSRRNTGDCDIHFDTPFGGQPSITATAYHNAFDASIGGVNTVTAEIIVIKRSDGSFTDGRFYFIAIGPR